MELVMRMMIQMIPDNSDLSEPSTPEFGTDEGLMQKKKHTIDLDLSMERGERRYVRWVCVRARLYETVVLYFSGSCLRAKALRDEV